MALLPSIPEQSQAVFTRRTILRLSMAAPFLGLAMVAFRRRGPGSRLSAQQETATPALLATPCAASPAALASASPAASPAPPQIVRMTNQLRFEPDHLTIRAGDTVLWLNDSVLPHTATGDPAQNPVAASHPEYIALPDGTEPWGSPLMQPGASFEHTFVVPGEYRYICIPHVLSGMRATVIVTC